MTPDERGRWNDARIDDFYEEFKRMAVIVEQVGAMQVSLVTAASDAKHARSNIHALRNDMSAEFLKLRNDTQALAITAAAERKSDRKWLVGAILSAAGLVIAAVGILAGHIG